MPDTCSCEPCRALDLALDRDLEARRRGVGIAEAARAVAEAGAAVDAIHNLDFCILNEPLWPKPWHFLPDAAPPPEERRRHDMTTPERKTPATRHVFSVGGVEINGKTIIEASVLRFSGALDDVSVGEIISAAIRDVAGAIWQAGAQAAVPIASEAGYNAGRDHGLQLAAALAGPMAEVRATLDDLTTEMRRPKVTTVVRGSDGEITRTIQSPAT